MTDVLVFIIGILGRIISGLFIAMIVDKRTQK